MSLVDQLKTTLATFPRVAPNAPELVRLRGFLAAMQSAGIAKTREYDLPLPNTIGRAANKVGVHDRPGRR